MAKASIIAYVAQYVRPNGKVEMIKRDPTAGASGCRVSRAIMSSDKSHR